VSIKWLSQTLNRPKLTSNKIESNSGSESRKTRPVEIPNFISWLDLLSKCKQELLVQISTILGNSYQIPLNSIEFQTLEIPQFLIQNLSIILKSSNTESCPLFNSLQIHILFEIFQARELYLWLNQFKLVWIFLNKYKCYYSFRARPTSDTSPTP
jgi:hypothetical protein